MSGAPEQKRRARAVATAIDRDIDTVAVWAVRYALGRSTYAVGDVCDVLIRRRHSIRATTRAVIVDDINRAEQDHNLGMEMDAIRWRELRHLFSLVPLPANGSRLQGNQQGLGLSA